ncbi:MAG: hypothetical protein Q9222_005946 [Ikaeria aurantiellina]
MGIEHMDLIFDGALATIIAASGFDANAGLPGVSQKIYMLEPGDRAIYQSLHESKYSSRAWTGFQEQLLAPRHIIFTKNGRPSFRCLNTAVVSEEEKKKEMLLGDGFHSSYPALGFEFVPPSDSMAYSYLALVGEYTGRGLTKGSDILYAFKALENGTSRKMKCGSLQGIPTVAFDFFLLFDSADATLDRRIGFPSWSWAGWRGRTVSCMPEKAVNDLALVNWLRSSTWIVWFYRRRWQPPVPVRTSGTASYISKLEDRWDAHRMFDFCEQGCPSYIDPSRTEPSLNIALKPSRRKTHLLQFWTLSVHLTCRWSLPDSPGNQQSRCVLLDNNDKRCGWIRPSDHHSTNGRSSDDMVEIILITGNHDGPPEVPEKPQVPDSYWVLLIERDDDGLVAERKGLGEIKRDAIDTSLAPGPAWKEIILA